MVWFLDILKEDATTSLTLALHRLLSIFPLLIRLVKKVSGKVLHSHTTECQIMLTVSSSQLHQNYPQGSETSIGCQINPELYASCIYLSLSPFTFKQEVGFQ
ncbi:Ferritin heavy chain [Tupaia chinensis]|uniref:Ferritin heavy chain n=1 Tax=Tupaia chinensis TaxID=246437 RepID=L9L9C8_TUPCH|nr:Ferritin heavy chain [Tupaia chinensis]